MLYVPLNFGPGGELVSYQCCNKDVEIFELFYDDEDRDILDEI